MRCGSSHRNLIDVNYFLPRLDKKNWQANFVCLPYKASRRWNTKTHLFFLMHGFMHSELRTIDIQKLWSVDQIGILFEQVRRTGFNDINKNNFLASRFLQNNLVLICYKGLQSLFQVEWNFWSKIPGSCRCWDMCFLWDIMFQFANFKTSKKMLAK